LISGVVEAKGISSFTTVLFPKGNKFPKKGFFPVATFSFVESMK